MTKYKGYEFDNRDAGQMYEYMEARIEALNAELFSSRRKTRRCAGKASPMPFPNPGLLPSCVHPGQVRGTGKPFFTLSIHHGGLFS